MKAEWEREQKCEGVRSLVIGNEKDLRYMR